MDGKIDRRRVEGLEGDGKPRAGRKPIGPQVSISLPAPYVDKLMAIAHQHGLSLSDVGRQIVILGLKRL